MRGSASFAFFVCVLILLAIAGCSAESALSKTRATALSTSPNPPGPSAPPVPDPLDIATIRAEPCVGVTHDQLAPYMGTIRKQETRRDAKSLACDWYAADGHRNSVSLFVYPETSLTEMYGASLGFSYFNRAEPAIGDTRLSVSHSSPTGRRMVTASPRSPWPTGPPSPYTRTRSPHQIRTTRTCAQ